MLLSQFVHTTQTFIEEENIDMKQDVTYLARTNYRNGNKLFGIKQADRFLHTYIIGKTGTGKTSLLETMMKQDIENGKGFCFLDPHGDAVSKLVAQVSSHRQQDVIYLDFTNLDQPWGYNPLKKVAYEHRSLVTSAIIEVFKKLWSSAWGVKLEHILRYTLLALLDQPEARISDIPKMLYDKEYRKEAINHITNIDVLNFWKKEFPRYQYFDTLPVLNKIGSMLAYPPIKRFLVENTREISLRRLMDEGKILLVNLAKGKVGEDVAQIAGSLLLTSLSSAAFSRANISEEERVPFFIYADEYQHYGTLSLVNMLSELRKYKLGMIMTNQYMQQLSPEIRNAVLGNVGTHISFRVDTIDAKVMTEKMYPVFSVEDFVNLPNFNIYLTLMIDGSPSKPFSAVTNI